MGTSCGSAGVSVSVSVSLSVDTYANMEPGLEVQYLCCYHYCREVQSRDRAG